MLTAIVAPLALWAWAARALALPEALGLAAAFTVGSAAIVLGMRVAPLAWLARTPQAPVAIALGIALSLLSLKLPPFAAHLVGAVGLIVGGGALGATVGSRMQRAGHLLPVALVSSAVDLWSVTSPHGPTHAIVQKPGLLRLLTVSVTIPSERDPQPAIGVGDVVFVALYLSAAQRFSLPLARTVALLGAGILAAGAAATAAGTPVPALPTLGLAMVLGHPEARRVHVDDRKATAFAALLFVASVLRAALNWQQLRGAG